MWKYLLPSLMCISGCGYGKVSPKAYEFAQALYSICNRHDSERLDKVTEMISNAREAGELTEQETTWLRDIIEDAREGDWEEGALAAREIMQDQVEGGP